MASKPKVLCFAGSLRNDSFNKKLVKLAMTGAKEAGVDTTYIDLKEYPLPVYDGDYESEHGLPKNAQALKHLFFDHDGLLIASPEYNSSVSAALKNVIDWVSRPADNSEKMLACFDDKVAGIMAASPGALGGLRGLIALRSILGNIKVLVVPEQQAIAKSHEAFDQNGSLKDERQNASVKAIGAKVATICSALAGEPVKAS
ncbi:MAG: NAD(P)H-dependent oxidoreductase [Candidatus Obscuribacterales bacterium]|nr:NAD(P)H-dependent oxidoreductase [Candidatus Obscuribacterales bacterium]